MLSWHLGVEMEVSPYMDGHSSYRTVTFLKTKLADVTLNVFKTYHNEAEQRTGKKLKCVRLDMG